MPPGLPASRSVDTLGVKELYSLKHETTNRALNAKMLSSLYAKPPSLSVQVASVTNSPLISQYISSPIVARAKVKDPLERKNMFDSLARADKVGGGGWGVGWGLRYEKRHTSVVDADACWCDLGVWGFLFLS